MLQFRYRLRCELGSYTHSACLIAGYSVDVRQEDVSHWESLTSFAGGFAYVAKELKKGTHYRFRVRAENKFGASEAAETGVIIAKDPYGTRIPVTYSLPSFVIFCFIFPLIFLIQHSHYITAFNGLFLKAICHEGVAADL